jgi:hypothetical protein
LYRAGFWLWNIKARVRGLGEYDSVVEVGGMECLKGDTSFTAASQEGMVKRSGATEAGFQSSILDLILEVLERLTLVIEKGVR